MTSQMGSLRKKTLFIVGILCSLAILAVLAIGLFAGWYSYTENRNIRQLAEKSRLRCEHTPLHCLIKNNSIVQIKDYIEHGKDLELRDNWGQSALHWATKNRKTESINLLLEAGANPNAKNERGITILHEAILTSAFDLARKLIAHGADVNTMNDNQHPSTILHTCVHYRRAECVQFLLENGAKTSIKDSFGYTVKERLSVQDNVNEQIQELIQKHSP